MIPDRIRRARILRGMSLDGLAQNIGDITKQGLSKFERGLATPNSTRLLQLAKALQVKPEYFLRPESVSLAALEFRKRARMPQYRQQQVEEQVREHLERYLALERCFDAADVRVAPPPPHTITVGSVDAAEEAAARLRRKWNVGNDAISNLTELLEEHGIKVALIDAQQEFDGACAASADAQHVLVALNTMHPGERMRFTAAHELGHWMMGFPLAMLESEKELCCNRFAGAFLYPRDRVVADFGDHHRARVHVGELLNAKRRYGISMQLALRRLKDLQLLSDAGYKGMMIQLSRVGWRTMEPESFVPERPRRFESLVFRGLAEDLFSPSRAAEFLQCPISDLEPTRHLSAGTR